jgi:glucose/arabinose dehydrogenase
MLVFSAGRTWCSLCKSGPDNGKIYHNADGSIPKDNPFVGVANAKAIYTYGNRNPQGMTKHPVGAIWEHEHGPQGGDEINIVKGANYGWPVATYGIDYDNTIISNIQQKKAFKILNIMGTLHRSSGMAFISSDIYLTGREFSRFFKISICRNAYFHRGQNYW